MFKNLFKRKTKVDRLESEYKALLKKAFRYSKIDRVKSDEYMYKAERIVQQIAALTKTND